MSKRIDWKALESEYMAAGDEMTLESLALKHGVSLVALTRHTEAERWEFGQARWRVYMGRPQKTDILKRMREDWDKRCADLFEKAAVLRKQELEAGHEHRK